MSDAFGEVQSRSNFKGTIQPAVRIAGMMDGAYFVGRGELLAWINDFFHLPYTKIEQCASGALYCQVVDALAPGKIALSKVNFEAKHEYEYVNNFKVLQSGFDRIAIKKHIEVDKLIKGKYMDNLEFLQWMKRYFDLNYRGQEYDAIAQRGRSKGGQVSSATKTAKVGTTLMAPQRKTVLKAPNTNIPAKSQTAAVAQKNAPECGDQQQKQVDELKAEVNRLRVTVEDLEKERDFFFNKLQEIEVICHTEDQESEFVQKIQHILYGDSREKEN